MRLLRFSVSSFRSLDNVTLDFEAARAQRVAVLRGKNGAGKSNVLRAIDLWFQLLWHGPSPGGKQEHRLPEWDLGLSADDFCRQKPGLIKLSGKITDLRLVLNRSQFANPHDFNDVEAEFLITRSAKGALIECTSYTVNEWSISAPAHLLPQHGDTVPFQESWRSAIIDVLRLHALKHIPAFRRLEKEAPAESRSLRPHDLSVEHLQEFLFDAQHSPDPVLRDAYKRFQSFITAEPLKRGHLTVIKDAAGLALLEERELGAVVADLPVQSLGSGDQEVLVLMALVFLSSTAIVAIEEPEAHLHWTNQRVLREALRKVAEDDSVLPLQVLLESHSHEFQYGDFFFDVTRNEATGLTEVVHKPNEEAYPHFNEPGPVRDALRGLLRRTLRPDEVLFHLLGSDVTAGEMMDWLERNDPRAREFLEQTARSVLLAMANERRVRRGNKG
jgi:ABC-type transport system involved in cytochrome c biogenesis ATPase subunit